MSSVLLSVENAVVDLPTPRGNLRAVDHVDLAVGAGDEDAAHPFTPPAMLAPRRNCRWKIRNSAMIRRRPGIECITPLLP